MREEEGSQYRVVGRWRREVKSYRRTRSVRASERRTIGQSPFRQPGVVATRERRGTHAKQRVGSDEGASVEGRLFVL